MMLNASFPLVPYAVDYEYIPLENGSLNVVCGVSKNLLTGQTERRWRDEMGVAPFFDCGPGSVMIAFNAQAEMESHLAMGWPLPVNVICLYAEHMLDTNGAALPEGVKAPGSLLTALKCDNLPAREAIEKKSIIDRILVGPPYADKEKLEILNYCQHDVDDAALLFNVLCARLNAVNPNYLEQALIRGEYAKALAKMTVTGCPINVPLHDAIICNWDAIRSGLLDSVAHYGIFDSSGTFKYDRFATIIEDLGASDVWPVTNSGHYSTKSADFRNMTQMFPVLEEFRSAYEALVASPTPHPFPICSDGYVRLGRREYGNARLGISGGEKSSVGFGAYRAKTGRNQPRAAEFLPAGASWWRTVVTPPEGKVIGYFDYKSQEYGVAAYLSGDKAMIEDYSGGEVYLPLGVRAGLIPADATKASHGDFRDRVLKPVLLGLQYGRQPKGIAMAIGGGNAETFRDDYRLAEQIYNMHKKTHADLWKWVENVVQDAFLKGRIETALGWHMLVGDPMTRVQENGRWEEYGTKPLTLMNWRMQATGADIIRIACSALTLAGIQVIYPVHDAILFIADKACKEEIGDLVAKIMERAAFTVLGASIPVDRQWVLPGDNWRPRKGDKMWAIITKALAGHPELKGVK
jgi:DNA polymerase-1